MFDSMRSRLTIWYTGVLALVLVIFAVAAYAYLARAAQKRTDRSLADTASSLISNFAAEYDEDQSGDDAAAEVMRGFHFGDRQALIFDEAGRVVAASDAPADARAKHTWPDIRTLSQSLAGLFDSARPTGRAYATVPGPRGGIRALAARAGSDGQRYFFVITQSLRGQEEELEQARHAFYLAIPLTLIVASLGGYMLARKSLAPVVEMGDRAARIGAYNLSERLPAPSERNELGRLARIFNELLARLELSFEQQRRFMADASHELRTPVAIVCGESEVALSQQVRSPEEYRESLAILHDEGRRLTRIVEDLFTLARADAGQYHFAPENFYLDETAGECVRAVRSLAAQHGLEISYQVRNEELPFRGDEGLVRRMILNLLDNSIKYTPPGGRVSVEVGRQDSGYSIRINDTGPGIPLDAQPHVFERFYRVDKARSRNGEAGGTGAGLGLSIASWIAEVHGGRVTLAASDRQGSTFVITLPSPPSTAPLDTSAHRPVAGHLTRGSAE
jgi:two-component system OmpR family sensor kinase